MGDWKRVTESWSVPLRCQPLRQPGRVAQSDKRVSTMAALQETGRRLTLEIGETCRGQWWASGRVGWYHTSFVKGMGGDEREGNGAYIQFFISNSPNKQRAPPEKTALRKWLCKGTEERSVTKGGCEKTYKAREREGLIHTHLSHAFEICPAVFVFHVCMNSRRGISRTALSRILPNWTWLFLTT